MDTRTGARRRRGELIYSSVGGADRQTGIPHFESATILRPVFFFREATESYQTVIGRRPLYVPLPPKVVARP